MGGDGTRLAVAFVLASAVALSQRQAAGGETPSVKIMPLGDSITEAYGGQASYRYFLWHMLADGGYEVDFVGSRKGVLAYLGASGPRYQDFDQDHEGHCAWTAAEVLLRVEDWVASAEPDVVLVHLGTNDLGHGRPIESIVRDLGAIVDAIRAHNPRAAVLLAQIIPAWGGDAVIRAFNERIPALAAEKHTEESPVVVVDHWTGFSAPDDLCDGLHPNEEGERKMAARWYEALKAVLPAPAPPRSGRQLGPHPPVPPAPPQGIPEGGGCVPGGEVAAFALAAPWTAVVLRRRRTKRRRTRSQTP